MTTPKIETTTVNGYRHYKHPNLKNVAAPSVTSIIDMLPAPFLRQWNSKVTAQSAVENLPMISDWVDAHQEQKAVEWLKGAADRELHKAADVGDRVHKACEDFIVHGKTDFQDDIAPFMENFFQFCNRFEPEWLHVEKSVFSVTHMYAGSFDAIAKINNKTAILDFKTTRSGISPKVALQLSAYAHADVMFDGITEMQIPKIEAGAAVWLRPDQWMLQPLRVDEEIFMTFLALRRTFEWEARQSKTATLAPMTFKGAM